MRQFLVVTLFLLTLVGAVAAQTPQQDWLRGSWEGTGYQTDDASTWTMRLTMRPRKKGAVEVAIEYPSLKCGGRWQLLSANKIVARFRERLTTGQNDCANNGSVLLQRLSSGQLLFLYSNQGSRTLTASALLNRAQRND